MSDENNQNDSVSGKLDQIINKLNEHDERIRAMESRVGSEVPQQAPGVAPVPPPPPIASNDDGLQKSTEPQTPSAVSRFVEWLKEDWLLKLGALLVLIGFGWLVSYAFLNNWIGPIGRIAMGLIAGVLLLILGEWRIRTYVNQGGVFLVLGSTVVLLTIFAAREVYDFLSPLSALVVMFLSTAFVALSSVKHKSQSLAVASLVLAGLAPLLTSNANPTEVALFSYLLVVVLGTVWVVGVSGWRALTFGALILVGLYSLPILASYSPQEGNILLMFSFVFTAIFFVTNILGILKLKEGKIKSDLISAAGTGLFLLIWIMIVASAQWQSLLIAAWMIAFIAGAFATFKITARREPFYVYTGVSIAMLATATAAELSGPALVIAYTIESAVVALISYAILKDIHIAQRLSLLMIGPVALSFESMRAYQWRTSVFHDDFAVLAMLMFALVGMGLFFLKQHIGGSDEDSSKLAKTLLIIGSLYAFVLLWLSLHAAMANDDTATMVSLVIYTIAGLAVYFYGRINNENGLRNYGGIILAFVVGRLLFVEVWNMELTGRIVTFFLVGTLLMSTAFIGRKKHKEKIEEGVENSN